MKISVERKELFDAFAKAQGEVTDVVRNTKSYKGKYAGLDQVVKEIRRVFSKHGLSFVQMPGAIVEGVLRVENAVFHKSGQHFSFVTEMMIGKCPNGISEAQHIGMIISYARRYALLALAGMAQEDDDAQLAYNDTGYSNSPADKVTVIAVAKTSTPKLSETHKDLKALIKHYEISEEVVDKWRKNFKVDSLSKLSEQDAKYLIDSLKSKYEAEIKEAMNEA